MTKARDLANIISGGFDATDIPNLDTAKITSGTFVDARLPATALNSNVDLTTLSASNLTSGTVPTARLGSGTADATTFLRGDNTFASPSAGFTLSSTVSTTSGTAIDFTGIPSTARLIIVNFYDYSKSGGNSTLIQLGTSGGFVTSGYISAGVRTTTGPSIGAANKTDGFGVPDENGGYETAGQAIITCVDVSNNKWIYSFTGRGDSSLTMTAGGFIALGGTLTQIKVKPSGSDTFDTGAINLQYI
tara:strand:+ start:258 stop:995 length:738 start_codon:yes stop_codon:yes gene_type:complete